MVLVAGGIGLTPALAIIRDILYRYKDMNLNSTALPTSITLYHCVRTSQELCVLNSFFPNQILPGYETLGLRIQVHVYITSKNVQDYQQILQGESVGDSTLHNKARTFDLSKFTQAHLRSQPTVFHPSFQRQAKISNIGSTGSTAWVATITIASFIGYFILSGIANVFIVKSYKGHSFPNYNRAHVVVACMFLGIIIFGGLVVLLWLRKVHQQTSNLASVQPRIQSPTTSPSQSNEDHEKTHGIEDGLATWDGDVHIFSRPNWKGM